MNMVTVLLGGITHNVTEALRRRDKLDEKFNLARTVANAVSRWLNYKKDNANSIGGIEALTLNFAL